jgi:hypothetical protein
MQKLVLAMAMLALGACGGRVEVIGPLPNGDVPDEEGMDVGAFPQLEILGYDPYAVSFFAVALSNAEGLDGVYDAWCVDPDTGSSSGNYLVELYSSYATLPPGTVGSPANLDLVNYVINHFVVGDSIDVDFGTGQPVPQTLTVDDIQGAIWQLVDPSIPSWGYGAVQTIFDEAAAEGEGFVPGCDELMAVIALPIANQDPSTNNDVQVLALEMPAQPTGCP